MSLEEKRKLYKNKNKEAIPTVEQIPRWSQVPEDPVGYEPIVMVPNDDFEGPRSKGGAGMIPMAITSKKSAFNTRYNLHKHASDLIYIQNLTKLTKRTLTLITSYLCIMVA